MNLSRELWVDIHRPKQLKDYVWQDEQTKSLVDAWIQVGASDNVLLYGPAGVGKTTLAQVLLKELNITRSDTLWMNASREGNIEEMRTKVHSFISTGGWNGMKYVVLDEADGLTLRAQEALRADMEEYSNSVRWILTANHENKLSEALRDRCTKIAIQKPDRDSYELKMCQILKHHGISIESDESLLALNMIIKKNYPSIRGCIRDLQRYSATGSLEMPQAGGSNTDWRFSLLDLFRKKEIRAARHLICSTISGDEIIDVYTWLYQNSEELFGEHEESAVLVIRDHLIAHANAADPEINLAACFIKLGRL